VQTQCISEQLVFQDFVAKEASKSVTKKVIVDCKAEIISSDGGLLFLREIENRHHIIKGMLEHFRDYRKKGYVTHSLYAMLTQRIFAIVQGYEDLNDHDILRNDPVLSLACNLDQTTKRGAGKSTLDRLEEGLQADRYHNIEWRAQGIREYLIDIALNTFKEAPKEIILDVDTTDFILNGNQEGRFFSGYYDEYCYQPLYIFAGELLVCADLLTGESDHEPRTRDALTLVIKKIRERWPRTRIIVRGDGGFCRESLMALCEKTPYCYYVFGLPKNSRLCEIIDEALTRVESRYQKEKTPQREYLEFRYQTRKSWTKERRVIAKAEYTDKGGNPRFVVASLPPSRYAPQKLYERVYCARGDMENRIKEQKLDLFADCSSMEYKEANQFRLWLTCIAYYFALIIRRGLEGTEYESASIARIRLCILKVAVEVLISTRRIRLSVAKAFPWWDDWIVLHRNLLIA
jgi:hypothetical protein